MAIDPQASYYDAGGVEVLDVIRAKLTPDEFAGFLKGNALKYLCRANFKGSHDRDLEKAQTCLRVLLDGAAEVNTPVCDYTKCPLSVKCSRHVANGAKPRDDEAIKIWWATWRDGDPATCEGFLLSDEHKP